jgi:hypothetical protein
MLETLLFLEDQVIVHKTENGPQRTSYKICKERNFKICTLNIMEFKVKGYIRRNIIIGNKAIEPKKLVTLNANNFIK